jgi:hypothetical protein
MQTSHTSSLLVAALVMLRHPCSRNKATAQFLLERAAEHADLSPAEREACRSLADDLDNEPAEQPVVPTSAKPAKPGKPIIDWGIERRLNIVAATLPFTPDLKGLSA